MQKEEIILLGKILGEVYRIQRRSADFPCAASRGKIYGLLNGIEEAITDEIRQAGFASSAQTEATARILDEIYRNDERMAAFKGFYDIEKKLSDAGVDRGKAIKILRYFYAEERFVELIDKMNSDGSPTEAKRFKLYEFDE